MDKDLQYFIKDKYKVIKVMIENEVQLKGKNIVPLSQDDISELTNFSKAKVNDIVKDLIKNKYITFISNGHYAISNNSKRVYKYLEDMSK